jgi:hypothetical protein
LLKNRYVHKKKWFPSPTQTFLSEKAWVFHSSFLVSPPAPAVARIATIGTPFYSFFILHMSISAEALRRWLLATRSTRPFLKLESYRSNSLLTQRGMHGMHGIHLKKKGADLDKGGEAPDMSREQVLVLLSWLSLYNSAGGHTSDVMTLLFLLITYLCCLAESRRG